MRLLSPATILLLTTGCGEGMLSFDVDSGAVDSGPWWDTQTDDSGQVEDSGHTETDDPIIDSGDSIEGLVLHEICDHADEGQVKYVEVLNPSSEPISLGGYGLELYSNGSHASTRYEFPAITLSAGATFVLSSSGQGALRFESLYGRPADDTSSIAQGNGDDVYALTYAGSIIDVYGVIGQDGTGEVWEYKDSVAKRIPGTMPSPLFSMSSWKVVPGTSESAPFSAR